MKNKISRRSFLLMTGGSGAAVMLKPGEKFLNKLIAFANPPIYPKPGEWAFYSTTCRECPAGCGMLLWHRDGRVTKAEGNPLHPVNKGKLCIRGQSSVQGEYSPERLTHVLEKDKEGNFKDSNWVTALAAVKGELESGKKVMVISDLQTGSLAEVMTNFTNRYGGSAPLFYEPLNFESTRWANKEMYGYDLIPRYVIKDCDLIISFGAGFLETWLSPVEYARDFSEIHSFKENKIGKLIYLAPAETLTAVNADEFIKITPGSEAGIIYEVIHSLAAKGFIDREAYERFNLPPSNPLSLYKEAIEKISEQIVKAEAPVILAGGPGDFSQQGIDTVKAANVLNELLKNQARMDFSHYHALSKSAYKEQLTEAFESLTAGYILIIHNTNPAYGMKEAAEYIKRAGRVVYIGNALNETSELAHWILPASYPLEEWGDYEPWKGTISLMQPTMRPIYDTRSAGDIFLELTNDLPDRSFKEIVRDNWLTWYSNTKDANAEQEVPEETSGVYRQLLRKGTLMYKTDEKKTDLNPVKLAAQDAIVLHENMFFLYTYPSLFFYDGRLSNRSWLQEISHPVSNIAWQSWLDMNETQAIKLGIRDGDMMKISTGTIHCEIAVRLTDKVAVNTVALEMGQGHWSFGETANGIGVNAFSFIDYKQHKAIPVIKIENTGRNEELVYLNETKNQYGRELLKEIDFEDLQKGTAEKEEITWPTPAGYDVNKDLYQPHEHKEHRWGMIIDLQACIGCKACEAACYAENNIPVVGKESCKGGKEMSWLKVPPYHIKNNKTAFIPVPCQHCDAAPCEPVCPVFASVHTEEGLNAQIYNRCVGTRYCSNNCPYKVRRFNWSNIKHVYPMTLQLNPEVTVRERGVMEKCTFCIQRIRNAEDKAKIENRKVEDGEIVTACQQTCPTGAIVFGDINNENSKVKKLMNHDRRYQLLRELNTKPAVIYLKKINVKV
jgi:anaerobic selenocysteine-containing dehydrogenase/Fe-S-cluster-containing dehydrogenase component